MSEPTKATDGPLMNVQKFMDLGFLQEVNRLVLHPAGLALSVGQYDDGSWGFVGVHDWREDPEGVLYGPGELDADKRRSVRAEWARHEQYRIEALNGDYFREAEAIIQPIR